VQTIGIHLLQMWGLPTNTATLNMRGYTPPIGPLLGEVAWPDILVTKARSVDGVTLDVMLRRHQAPAATRVAIRFSRLTPGAVYTFAGQELVADGDGNATITIELSEPLVARLEPMATQ
jgi:hypothetical protein